MADTLDVLTLAEAKTILKIDETSNDTRLAQVITAVSRRMDDKCRPIVKRTIPVATYTPCGADLWVNPALIYSTPAMTVTEYNSAGTSQVLTLETYDTKPQYGYVLEPRTGLGGGYTGRIRRSSNGYSWGWGTNVRIVFDSGRYATTAAVDPLFKEAAGVILENWWSQVLPGEPTPTGEFDTPGYRFPRWAIPDAALDMLGDEAADVHALA